MSAQIAANGTFEHRVVNIQTGSATSTVDAVTAFDALSFDCRGYCQVVATFICTTNAMTVGWYVANLADYSDEVLVTTATALSVGTNKWWNNATVTGANTQANAATYPFAYARFKINPTGAGANGTVSVTLCMKNT